MLSFGWYRSHLPIKPSQTFDRGCEWVSPRRPFGRILLRTFHRTFLKSCTMSRKILSTSVKSLSVSPSEASGHDTLPQPTAQDLALQPWRDRGSSHLKPREY